MAPICGRCATVARVRLCRERANRLPRGIVPTIMVRMTPAAPGERTSAELLTQFLYGRDVPCPGCRYNLRDLTGTHCPECGLELRLTVGPAQPRFGVFILALVPLFMTAGLATVFWILSLDGFPPNEFWSVWIVMILAPLEVLSVIGLYRWRSRVLRLSAGARGGWRPGRGCCTAGCG